MDEKKEKEFDAFLESVVFVDGEGVPLPVVLEEDISEDVDDDRD